MEGVLKANLICFCACDVFYQSHYKNGYGYHGKAM